MERENLDSVSDIYSNDPFERENEIHCSNYVAKCVQYAEQRKSWLELGLGSGVVLQQLSEAFQDVRVLDGSPALVSRYAGKHPNVDIVFTYFEDYQTSERFSSIGMGFVLEHVNDPMTILTKYKKLLAPDGRFFIGVPAASSIHRLLAARAGLLSDIRAMSETDRRFGHKRYFTFDDWVELFNNAGLKVLKAEGLYLKPFSTLQMESLLLGPSIYEALGSLATELPQVSNACFFMLGNE